MALNLEVSSKTTLQIVNMATRGIFLLKNNYISLIKKFPNGQENRLEHFDKWVQSWKDPDVHTYYNYFKNLETQQHPAFLPDCPKAKAALQTAENNHRPVLAQFHRRAFPTGQYFADDNLLSQDIKNMTLRQFFKGFLSKETRTDLQRYLVWFSCWIVGVILYTWVWVFASDEEQTIVQLEPHPSHYHYQITNVQEYVKQHIDKINFLEKHSRDMLLEAKKRAEERQRLKKNRD